VNRLGAGRKGEEGDIEGDKQREIGDKDNTVARKTAKALTSNKQKRSHAIGDKRDTVAQKTAKREIKDRPTLRGLTRGSLLIKSTRSRLPCLLVCRTCPSWIFVLPELGLEARMIWLEDPAYLELTQRLVGPECRILVGTSTETSGFVTALPDVRLGLIDGALTTDIVSALEGIGLDTLYYTRRLRRKIPGWNNSNSPIIHHEGVGGVTQAALRLGALTRGKCSSITELPAVAPRDASTVLSVMPDHYTVRVAPRSRHVNNGACINLGTGARPHYHGGGGVASRRTDSENARSHARDLRAKRDMGAAPSDLWRVFGVSRCPGRNDSEP
jgi:hypothetical protein